MREDRDKWNEKYFKKSFSSEPTDIVKKFYKLAPKGIALDIAAGAGKNALFLAEKGFRTEALDISDVALRKFAGRHANLYPVCIDMDTFNIPSDRYSLILNIRFLNRRLFPYIDEGLISGGVLIFETYLDGPRDDSYGPATRDYLLRKNELLRGFLSLNIVFYQEKKQRRHGETRHMASLVARKE